MTKPYSLTISHAVRKVRVTLNLCGHIYAPIVFHQSPRRKHPAFFVHAHEGIGVERMTA